MRAARHLYADGKALVSRHIIQHWILMLHKTESTPSTILHSMEKYLQGTHTGGPGCVYQSNGCTDTMGKLAVELQQEPLSFYINFFCWLRNKWRHCQESTESILLPWNVGADFKNACSVGSSFLRGHSGVTKEPWDEASRKLINHELVKGRCIHKHNKCAGWWGRELESIGRDTLAAPDLICSG